jgi:hypothetical protein
MCTFLRSNHPFQSYYQEKIETILHSEGSVCQFGLQLVSLCIDISIASLEPKIYICISSDIQIGWRLDSLYDLRYHTWSVNVY